MGDKYLSKETVKITISFNGKEKKIPLVVQPSSQLSDAQAQSGLESVTRLVQQIFKIVDSRSFTLRDSFSYNKLTKNSFKQEKFPLKWNVVFDKDDMLKHHGGVLIPSTGLYTGYSAEVLSRTSYPSRFHTMSHEVLSSTRSDPFGSSQIAFPVDMGKNVFISSDNGCYGFLLRHFSIRESHEPSQENELRATSPDSERMSTVFVYKLQPNGPAKLAGLNEGDKVYSINGQSITRCSLEQVQRMLLTSHQDVVLQVSPKNDDVLQLFRYAPLAYGPTGEHMTKLGRAWVYDVNISQCSDWLKDDINLPQSNHNSRIDSHDYMTTPSAGSSSSHDNMVTPPVTAHLSSSESSSRYASPMANSPVIGGSHSSSGSHLMDDVYITGSLSQIPVSPSPSLHDVDREDSLSPVPHRIRPITPPLHFTHVRTLSPHPPSVAVTHRRSSPDPYRDASPYMDSPNGVIDGSHTLRALDSVKSTSSTLLDCKPYGITSRSSAVAVDKALLQHRAASSPSLDHVSDQLPQQPHPSCNHDVNTRAAATSSRRGSKLSLEDLTRIEPCRDVKKKSSDELAYSNGDLLDSHVERPVALSPIEDGHSSVTHSQELSLSGNMAVDVNSHRGNKKSYSSQRERLHRSLSKPLTGTSQSASSDGSYPLEYSLSSDHITEKSSPVTTDTSQVEYDNHSGSQEFTRQRANSFKKYLESSLHEAFRSLDDDEEEAMALEVKSVQYSQDGAAGKLSPASDHNVDHLASCDTSKGFSPGASPKKPHRILIHEDSSSSQPFQMERTRSHTIERVFSDGNFHERRQKSSGSIFSYRNRGIADKQRSVDDQVMLRQTRTIDSIVLQQASCHGLLYRKVEKESGRRSHDRSWKCFYGVLKDDNHLYFYKDRSDVDQNKKVADENPINVMSALADIAHNYTKRKFVFRLATQSGLEMLLQTEGQASLMSWVKAIQTCNEGHAPQGGRDARTALIIKKKDKQMKGPSSPPPVRKAGMPSPTSRKKNASTGKASGEGGTRLPLFELIKNSLRLHRSRNNTDEPDSSSYITFGIDLDSCPASIENKLVPLVVEFCVHHIEDHGLDVEGLYRVPGTRGTVNKIISELNKGNYHHDYSSGQWGDVHNYTSLLKSFFNDLPDPIIPSNMYHQFVAAAKEHDFNRLYTIKQLIYRLPAGNKHTLKFLLAHLRTVHQHAGTNKMSMKNLCIVFGPTLMRCPVHEVGPSYIIMELFLKNMESFFEDVDLSRESLESTGNERLLPKQLNADKQLNVDQTVQKFNQSDVKVVSSEASSIVGSIWKKNSPRNPQIHKSPSRSEDLPMASLVETPQTIPEGRVVNIDEAIACRISMHQDYTSSTSSINDVPVRNGKLDRHGDSNRNHRLLGDRLMIDHGTGVAIDSSSSSLGTTSSDEHMFKNYFDNSWDQLRHKKLSPQEPADDVPAEGRVQTVTSPYTTHLESDL